MTPILLVLHIVWYTYQGCDVQDHRKRILEAGLTILREQGLAGLTQPRVAAMTGLRQSHLTYYYPTRADLRTAVARVAIETQLAGLRALVNSISSPKLAAAKMAAVAARHQNTRVLVALNQAADQEPTVQALFNELLDGFVAELATLLDKLQLSPTPARIDLLHALLVGLSVIDLATGRKNYRARTKAALSLAFDLLSGEKA
jgi:AcrR family transcriptional regulator